MTESSEQWLDEIDQAILDQVGAVHMRLDPPPADLNARVQFAIALEQLDFEVARLADDVLVGSGARSAERTRTMTFDSESLTIMVSFADAADGQLRLDGWLAPASPLRVELRVADQAGRRHATSSETTADEAGRFVFDAVGHGLAQLLVHPAAGSTAGLAASVVTPSFML
jgi:hypothetical protein